MAKVWTIKERYYLGVGSGDSRKELLILGGRSSIAKPFIEIINAEGHKRITNRQKPTILSRVKSDRSSRGIKFNEVL
jgi:hypothetical protein